jgi:hypothetical protein
MLSCDAEARIERRRDQARRLIPALLILSFAAPTTVSAQDAAPSIAELKAQAWDAQQAAAQAQAAAEAAQQKASEMVERAASENPPAVAPVAEAPPAPAPAPETPPTPAPTPTVAVAPPAPQTTAADPEIAALRDEIRQAKEAAAAAEAAAIAMRNELAEHEEKHERRFSRPGFFIAGGLAWAPQMFDTRLDSTHGEGAYGAIGYRFTEYFELEMRFDPVRGFDLAGQALNGNPIVGKVDGWSTTLNGRLFILTGKFQPYLAFGLGAGSLKASFSQDGDGNPAVIEEVSAYFRPSAGFDFYVSETLALTFDAAIQLPSGRFSSLTYATLGGGIKLRF